MALSSFSIQLSATPANSMQPGSAKQHPAAPHVRESRIDRGFSADQPLHSPYTVPATPMSRVAVKDPDESYSNAPMYTPLEGPNGTTWYYRAQYQTQSVKVSEYYTERLKTSFTFTIYDDKYNLVGTVKDKIRFEENERWTYDNKNYYGRDVECVLDPAVTLHFFNDDDKPEIMVYHAMNTLQYINHYYYDVYTVGGEKDKSGNDIPIARIEGRCIEAIDASDGSGEENFYITFVLDPVVDWNLSDPDALEKLHNSRFHLTTYKKADENGEPQILIEKDIYNTRIPGDTTEGIYYMTKKADGKIYFVYSQYEKPYFIDPRGGASDERPTPDNALLIEVYTIDADGTSRMTSDTRIPVNAEDSTEDKLVYTFLSIGSVAWTDDVDMIYNGTPEKPAYIAARDVAYASSIEDVASTYLIYDNDGNIIRTLATNTESIFLYPAYPGEQPLIMFVKPLALNNYQFDFSFLYSGELVASINQQNGGDPIYASCVPVKGEDSIYRIAAEMQRYETDLQGNDYTRVAWFGSDGTLQRIDRVNMGKNVQASLINMERVSMDPYLYDTDDKMEYAVLVKRSNGSTIRNEFLVVDDTGERYATFSADDGKGNPSLFTIFPGDPNRLQIIYYGWGTNIDYYNLPFPTFPPKAIEDQPQFNGIGAIGEEETGSTEYFDLGGRIVTHPGRGVYLRRTSGGVEKILR